MATAQHRDKQVGLMLTCIESLILFNQWLLIFAKIKWYSYHINFITSFTCIVLIYIYVYLNRRLHSKSLSSLSTYIQTNRKKKAVIDCIFETKQSIKTTCVLTSYYLQQVIQMERKIKSSVKDFTRFISI